jgi:chromosome segregation ATPase
VSNNPPADRLPSTRELIEKEAMPAKSKEVSAGMADPQAEISMLRNYAGDNYLRSDYQNADQMRAEITELRRKLSTFKLLTNKLAERLRERNSEITALREQLAEMTKNYTDLRDHYTEDSLREAVRVLGEQVRVWRNAPHIDHVLSSYWADLPLPEKLVILEGSDVFNNPIAAAALKGNQ